MKIASKLKMALACIAFLSFAVSCDNDDDNPKTVDNTITGIAVKNSNLKILVQALTRAELAATLQGTGPFTVFAPTDAAFTKFLSDNKFASVNDVPKDVLTQILLNHVVSGTAKSTDLKTGYIKTLAKGSASATNTLSMYVDLTSGVKLNGGAKVTTADIMASNGVIHVVDAVIGLPTIVTHATANPNFSTLASLLTAQNLITTLSSSATPAPFTVFAPLNTAFDSATLSLYGGLTTAQKTAVLTYHVIGGANVLSTGIPASSPTLETGILRFSGTTITDEQSRVTNIVLTDVQCSNGIIHAVNKVLLPSL
ncbi:fasciclin domain-containing protein [Flavobacterium sp. RSSA_27]|uniref:fasciclin domain-containing protein n=1 Tax=Flavobacterium sp. RSSA_27 TaxID=3447667 RepID=UPI003F41666F